MEQELRNQTAGDGRIHVVKVSKWYRVYANDFINEDELWSVDEGTQATEKHCFKVVCASEIPVSTGSHLEAHPLKEPRAWLSVYGVAREMLDHKGRKLILITKK